MKEFEIGDKVWVHYGRGVAKGVIIDKFNLDYVVKMGIGPLTSMTRIISKEDLARRSK